MSGPYVVTPWGDDSIELRIESDDTELLNDTKRGEIATGIYRCMA